MSLQVIEGTWEEIKRHEAELIGRQLRVTIMPEGAATRKGSLPIKNAASKDQPKKLVGFGAFKDALPSSDDFMREKQAELDREEGRS